jgi:hypothetical protein
MHVAHFLCMQLKSHACCHLWSMNDIIFVPTCRSKEEDSAQEGQDPSLLSSQARLALTSMRVSCLCVYGFDQHVEPAAYLHFLSCGYVTVCAIAWIVHLFINRKPVRNLVYSANFVFSQLAGCLQAPIIVTGIVCYCVSHSDSMFVHFFLLDFDLCLYVYSMCV